MPHAVLLGDSIFDNARYVPDRPPVIEQVRAVLPSGARATLLAVDGHVTADVAHQLTRLPPDTTHLFVSVGGNDALGESGILREVAATVGDALTLLNATLEEFRRNYHAMLRTVLALDRPTAMCTVYDAIPGLEAEAKIALGLFNEVILRAAFAAGLPVIDLRLICSESGDFSHLSPIEPSVTGGAKIAARIAAVITGHDFSGRRSVVYT